MADRFHYMHLMPGPQLQVGDISIELTCHLQNTYTQFINMERYVKYIVQINLLTTGFEPGISQLACEWCSVIPAKLSNLY